MTKSIWILNVALLALSGCLPFSYQSFDIACGDMTLVLEQYVGAPTINKLKVNGEKVAVKVSQTEYPKTDIFAFIYNDEPYKLIQKENMAIGDFSIIRPNEAQAFQCKNSAIIS